MTKSRGEGRRLVQGGGVKIDGERVDDPEHQLAVDALGDGVVVRLGKKRALRVVRG